MIKSGKRGNPIHDQLTIKIPRHTGFLQAENYKTERERRISFTENNSEGTLCSFVSEDQDNERNSLFTFVIIIF